MLLTETHLHTKDVSQCGMVPAREIPALYAKAGYKCIIVTDHYNRWTLDGLSNDKNEQIEKWLAGYRTVKEYGEKEGLKVFLGMELALSSSPEDYLIYGVTEEFIEKYRDIFTLTLKEVYDIVQKEEMLIYQAHPFREYLKVQSPEVLNGVEVYNANPRHNSHNEKAVEFAKANSLLEIAGSDFHQYEDLAHGGIYLPEYINDNKALVEYLKSGQAKLYLKSKNNP